MLLSSGAANADWGDVYYCQMTNWVRISLNGTKINYQLEKFQFKLDQTKKSMVFGSGGYFGNTESILDMESSYPVIEEWYATSPNSSTFFSEGKLLESYNGYTGATAISADCDKF